MKKKIFLILSIFSILLSGTVIVSAESGKSGFAGVAVTDEAQAQYSLEELYRIADEIAAMTKEETGITAVEVSEAKKCVVVFCEDSLESGRIKELAKAFDEKYGINAVLFSCGDPDAVLLEEEISYDGVGAERTQNNWIYLLLVCIGILALGAAAFFVWHRRELAFQTTEGSVRSGSREISRKELIHEIRRSTLHPSGDTFSAVLEQINKQKQ